MGWIATALLIALKIGEVTDVSWWWVFAPVLFQIGFAFAWAGIVVWLDLDNA